MVDALSDNLLAELVVLTGIEDECVPVVIDFRYGTALGAGVR